MEARNDTKFKWSGGEVEDLGERGWIMLEYMRKKGLSMDDVLERREWRRRVSESHPLPQETSRIRRFSCVWYNQKFLQCESENHAGYKMVQ